MKDIELRRLVLAKYYANRRKGLIPVNETNFGPEITKHDALRISQQLHDEGLIKFEPLNGDDTIQAGVGEIATKGIDAIEGKHTMTSDSVKQPEFFVDPSRIVSIRKP